MASKSERTPLLSGAQQQQQQQQHLDLPDDTPHDYQELKREDRPLPKAQLALLCFARMVEPCSFFAIFTFVNEMVHETGISKAQTGFYTGIIESLFSLVQFIIMPFWGRLSDKRGRKPLLIQSLFGLAISSTLFGISQNVWQMMFFRCLSGFFSGSTVTIRTMISEISTSKTQARAFSLFAAAGNIAIFLAPLLGGSLANNPFLMRHFALFAKYPYLPPCMLTGLLSLTAALVNLIWLEETLVKSDHPGSVQSDASLTTSEILKSPGVSKVLLIYIWTFTLAFAYTALIPVFWFTPVKLGGYNFNPMQISILLATAGASQAFWTLLVFPPLHRRIGSKGIINLAVIGWPISIFLLAGLNVALRHHISYNLFWTLAILSSVLGSAISMSYTSVQLTLNDISPTPSSLGTLNGIGLSGMAATRSIAPAIITSIFAFGVEHHILWGQLAWLVMLLLAVAYGLITRCLPRKAWGLEIADEHREDA